MWMVPSSQAGIWKSREPAQNKPHCSVSRLQTECDQPPPAPPPCFLHHHGLCLLKLWAKPSVAFIRCYVAAMRKATDSGTQDGAGRHLRRRLSFRTYRNMDDPPCPTIHNIPAQCCWAPWRRDVQSGSAARRPWPSPVMYLFSWEE